MKIPGRMLAAKLVVYTLLSCCCCLQLSSSAANTSSSSSSSGEEEEPVNASPWMSIGVNYGQLADNLPPPHQVVKLLQSTHISKIRIFNTDPKFLQAFANTGIDVVVGLNNDQVPSFTVPSTAHDWVSQNIAPFSDTRIRLITVGNEVFTSNDQRLSSSILPAMQNIHSALQSLNLHNSIKVSTPHSFAVLADSFPPSSGKFHPDSQDFVKPLLKFLHDTGAPLLVNAYPYFAYRRNPSEIPLSYALFLPNPGAPDSKTGLIYTSLYTAQIDAAYSAMEKMGYFGIPVAVTETGWPSGGDQDEVGVTVQNAMSFNRNLIAHVTSTSGTPLRPRQPVDTYIFALFNENLKTGPGSERNYGLFRTDGSPVYDSGVFKQQQQQQEQPVQVTSTQRPYYNSSGGYAPYTPVGGASTYVPAPPPPQRPGSWCVAKPGTDIGTLIKALNYACGQGNIDCSGIQQGGICYFPDDVKAHASYAFNMYYQKYGHEPYNCNFGNAAMVTPMNPSYGSCFYPGEY